MKRYIIQLVVLLSFLGCGGSSSNESKPTNNISQELKVKRMPMENLFISSPSQSGVYLSSFLYKEGMSQTVIKENDQIKYLLLNLGDTTIESEYIDENKTIMKVGTKSYHLIKNKDILTIYLFENGQSLGGYRYDLKNEKIQNKLPDSSKFSFKKENNQDLEEVFLDAVKGSIHVVPGFLALDDFEKIRDKFNNFKEIFNRKYLEDSPKSIVPVTEDSEYYNQIDFLPLTEIKAETNQFIKDSVNNIEQIKEWSKSLTQKLIENSANYLELLSDSGYIQTEESEDSKEANYYLVNSETDKFVSNLDETQLSLLETEAQKEEKDLTELVIEAKTLEISDNVIESASLDGVEGMIGSLSYIDNKLSFEEYYFQHYGTYPPTVPNLDTMTKLPYNEELAPDIRNYRSNYLLYTVNGVTYGGYLNNSLFTQEDTDTKKGVHAEVRLEHNTQYNGTSETFLLSDDEQVGSVEDIHNLLIYLPTSPSHIQSYLTNINSPVKLNRAISFPLMVKGLTICPIFTYNILDQESVNSWEEYDYENVLSYTLNNSKEYISGEFTATMYRSCTNSLEEEHDGIQNQTYTGVGTPYPIYVKFKLDKVYIKTLEIVPSTVRNYYEYESKYPNHISNSVPSFYIGGE